MIYRANEGTVFNARQTILDDMDEPVMCKAGYPKVYLIDKDKKQYSSAIATPSQVPGSWSSNIAIPNFGLENDQEFTVFWRVIDNTGSKYSIKDALIVEPQVEARDSDIVAMFGDLRASFMLPTVIEDNDTLVYQMWASNKPLLAQTTDMKNDARIDLVTCGTSATRVTIPMVVPAASMQANLLKIDHQRPNALPRSYTYKLWAITPQMMLAMSHVESYVNKARIENVIPQLRYTSGDIVTYLERGLNRFNMLYQPTYFNGMNMQGVLFEAHIACACYCALDAQLQAEGALAFNFSGQGMSFDVDRTPQLDAAIGRLDSYTEQHIQPMKKNLAVWGITGGDGSIGNKDIHDSRALGSLSVINAATTRINSSSVTHLFRYI